MKIVTECRLWVYVSRDTTEKETDAGARGLAGPSGKIMFTLHSQQLSQKSVTSTKVTYIAKKG